MRFSTWPSGQIGGKFNRSKHHVIKILKNTRVMSLTGRHVINSKILVNKHMAAGVVTQAMINESFGLKRLLMLTEDYVQSKISSAVDYAEGIATSSTTYNFDRNNLRTDQCYTLALLYGLIQKDAALCSILGMSAEVFEPVPISQIIPWLRDGFQFTRGELFTALQFAAKLKKQKVIVPDSALKAVVQLAKEAGVNIQPSDDSEIAELFKTLNFEEVPVDPEIQKSLNDAVIAKNPDNIKAAIENGADPNYVLPGGMTNLHCAVTMKCVEAATTLLEKGARVDSENREGETSLCLAVKNHDLPMVKLLLTKGAKVNYLNACGHTAMHIAAREGFTDVIEELIVVGGADVSVNDSNGNTALHWAAAAGRADMVQFLNSKGVSVNTTTKSGWTPLHAAAEYNHQDVVKVLLERGAALNCYGEGGFTPLHMAADKGHLEMVMLLIKMGADASAKSQDGSTPADMAKESNFNSVFEYLQSLVI